MASVIFYEKPGCVGNNNQKHFLKTHDIKLEVRDLLSEAWTAKKLRPYFGSSPVNEWFNETAPAIKSGEIQIDNITEKDAINMMIENPLLIRRPLMKLGEVRQSGFSDGDVLEALNLASSNSQGLNTCPINE